MSLVNKKCQSCRAEILPLSKDRVLNFLKEISSWEPSPDFKKISRQFKFKDFKEAMNFINKVASLAEEEGHHPDIYISYNKVKLELWTHAISGLSENDFILAAKINQL